ncbi:hypothetical protein F5Y03DRAFT_129960 [Xylaria venustula]|nr:hypothetical protein F5Y03DRAFT_129960 [Xylaria venustula]
MFKTWVMSMSRECGPSRSMRFWDSFYIFVLGSPVLMLRLSVEDSSKTTPVVELGPPAGNGHNATENPCAALARDICDSPGGVGYNVCFHHATSRALPSLPLEHVLARGLVWEMYWSLDEQQHSFALRKSHRRYLDCSCNVPSQKHRASLKPACLEYMATSHDSSRAEFV